MENPPSVCVFFPGAEAPEAVYYYYFFLCYCSDSAEELLFNLERRPGPCEASGRLRHFKLRILVPPLFGLLEIAAVIITVRARR